MFQSLNWDGVISNFLMADTDPIECTFQSLNWDGVISNLFVDQWDNQKYHVSIPQLGWGDFKQTSLDEVWRSVEGFNPSIGMG